MRCPLNINKQVRSKKHMTNKLITPNKVISIVLFLVLAYLLPLSGNWSLLLSPQLAILSLISIILFLSQPQFSINDTNQQKNNDNFSVVLILIGCLLSQVFSIVEWAYFRTEFHKLKFDSFFSIGILLLFGGTIFRIWCIRSLGKYFTATVQTQQNQKIIKTGAYRIIRHPSYLGAYLSILGSSVILHSYLGIVFSAIVMFAAYYYRIDTEEKTLVKEFGLEYVTYQDRTKKMFPFIY